MQAVKLTLLESGLVDGQILELFGRVALKPLSASDFEWTAELNKRRFELIDRDIAVAYLTISSYCLAMSSQLMGRVRIACKFG